MTRPLAVARAALLFVPVLAALLVLGALDALLAAIGAVVDPGWSPGDDAPEWVNG